jgi:hypothetical protein
MSEYDDAKSKVDALLAASRADALLMASKVDALLAASRADALLMTDANVFFDKLFKGIDARLSKKKLRLAELHPERDALVKDIAALERTLSESSVCGSHASSVCTTCYDAPADTAIQDCYHVFCQLCCARFQRDNNACPVCRRQILRVQKLYF